MFALVAVLVVIVAILLRNDFHFEFSCHVFIIARLVIEWKFLCYNKYMDEQEIQLRRRENEERAASERARILQLPYLDTRSFEDTIP